MRGKPLFISLALHALAVALLLWLSRTPTQHRAIAVAVVEGAKKKPEPKPEEPPKPPPPPPAPRPRRPEPAPEVAASAPPPPASAPTPAPRPAALSTGLTLGNDGGGQGGGIAVGGLTHGPTTRGDDPAPSKQPIARREPVKPPPPPDEDPCTEAPSKPVPLVRTPDIEYTAQARADGVEGRLVLSVIISADGSVARVDVVSAVEAALDAAAVAAVKLWRFKPSTACGKPVTGGVFTLARRFELGD